MLNALMILKLSPMLLAMAKEVNEVILTIYNKINASIYYLEKSLIHLYYNKMSFITKHIV